MRLVLAALLLLAGCGQGAPPSAENRQAPPANVVSEEPRARNATNEAAAPPARPDPAALQGLSPRQRRAYETGYADCRAGRYEPDPWPEAYRIGCAAANDR